MNNVIFVLFFTFFDCFDVKKDCSFQNKIVSLIELHCCHIQPSKSVSLLKGKDEREGEKKEEFFEDKIRKINSVI